MKLKMKVVYIFLLLVIFFSLASKNVIPSSISENTKTGIEKINSMQSKTVADIKKDAINKKIDVEEKNIENIIDKAINAPIYTTKDYKEFFNNTVFMGDSLTEAIYAYGFLDSTSVVAEKGKNVMTALKDDVPKVINLVPNRVIMLYGMNDLECFGNLSDFYDKYKILINSTKEKLPEVQIIVISTFYTTDEAIMTSQSLSRDRVDEANKYIKKMCEEESITYLDLRSITSKKSKLYEPDGIHVVGDFYNIYLEVLMNVLKGE